MAPVEHAQRTATSERTQARAAPSLLQYDYLVLKLLARDIAASLDWVHAADSRGGTAIDIGAGGGPYRPLLEKRGFRVQTLDIVSGADVDIVGTAEHTGLADASVDLILCTQVLEHTRAPWLAMREFGRILRPGGAVVLSVPQVWFFHPHPHDYWRMTTQGVEALCDEAGLKIQRLDTQGSSATTLVQTLNFLIFGALGRAGAPLYALLNMIGLLAESLVRDRRFALNHSCVAHKPFPGSAR